MLFKIFLIAFSVFEIARARIQYTRRQTSWYWSAVWSLMWLMVIIVAVMPKGIDAIASYVGVGRGADLLVYTAIVFLLYANYRSMIRLRKIAIDNPDRP